MPYIIVLLVVLAILVQRDAFVDKVFEAAGLKLLHVRAAISYDPQAIKTMIGVPS